MVCGPPDFCKSTFPVHEVRAPMKTITLPVQGLNFAGCARSIEKPRGALAPIMQTDASYVSQTVTVTYDEARLSEDELRALVRNCGFGCGEPLTAANLLAASAET